MHMIYYMCGIFALLNSKNIKEIDIHKEFMKGQRRGPEFSKLDNNYMKMLLGFHRLAINGLNEESNQPLIINDIVLICMEKFIIIKNCIKILM